MVQYANRNYAHTKTLIHIYSTCNILLNTFNCKLQNLKLHALAEGGRGNTSSLEEKLSTMQTTRQALTSQ